MNDDEVAVGASRDLSGCGFSAACYDSGCWPWVWFFMTEREAKEMAVAEKLTVPELKYEKYRLTNGLDVILLEDHRLPLVAVSIWYHVGPVNERPGLAGFAHLFEHMMFEGSGHIGEEGHFRRLEAAGASEINGTTDFDRTNYFETLPSNQLELALWLESDRMGFLLEKLDDAKLENQRDVVRNERRQSIEGQPYGLIQEELFHQLFPKDHPYYASVIGSHADIEAARLEDVREFFRLYYAPNNASLAIVGDIDPEKTRALVDRYFASLPAGPPVPAVQVKTPPITAERRVVISDQVELPRIYLAWLTDPIYTQEDGACDLIAKILGGGKSSRMYKSLVYEKRIAQDVIAQQYSLALGSVFTIEATAKPGFGLDEIEAAIDAEIDNFCRHGASDAEIERARNTYASAIIRGLENLGGFGGVADRLNQYNHFLGDPGYLARDLARYENATPAMLQELARTRLARSARVVIHGIPGAKVVDDVPRSTPGPETETVPAAAAPSAVTQDWRHAVPPPGPPSPLMLPVPISFRLDNGLTVYLLEQHGLPIVSSNMVLLSGSDRNPPELPGLASYTADMLDEGTRLRSALEIAGDADRLGASLSTGSNMDASVVAFRSLKKDSDAVFALAADVLLNPEFPESELVRLRNDRLTQILQQKDNPNTLAARQLYLELYGPQHPYGHIELGTEAANRAIVREDLFRYWRNGYSPAIAALIVAGDVTEEEVRQLAGKHFGAWTGAGLHPLPPPVQANPRKCIIIVDKPASPQTVLRVGQIGIERAHPDYVSTTVLNAALGGLFSSRINANLREKHGFTYGASSTFVYRRGPGPFLIGTSVRTDVTAPAVTEILYEIDQIRTADILPDELAAARDSIARSLPGMFETTPQGAATIGQLFVHNLPLDYYRHLPDQIDGLSAADIRQAAERHLRPGEMTVVAVGDLRTIREPLEKLHFGPVVCLDVDGNPWKS
jgi:zinc protease